MDVRKKLVELPMEDALLVLREEHRQRTDSYTTYLAHGGRGKPKRGKPKRGRPTLGRPKRGRP